MRKILLLGYSYIAQKAIIPALLSNKKVKLVGIASKTNYSKIVEKVPVYKDYFEGIKNSDCDTVYISLHNSAHYAWILESLKNNKNVLCDKPVVLNREEASICCKAAGKKKLIMEAIPYLYHKQHTKLKRTIKILKTPIQQISIQFGFPPLYKKNFRYNKEMGGGCIYDLGPYLVTAGSYYYDCLPRSVLCTSYINDKFGVPTKAAVTLFFGKHMILQAYIGFELEYRNNLSLWGSNYFISIDRAFTIPKDYINTILIKTKDKISNVSIPASDSFSEMFNYFASIKSNSYATLNKNLLDKIIVLESIVKSSVKGRTIDINYES